jgi:hypothetical protein
VLAQAVRGMKAATCSVKSATATGRGRTEIRCSNCVFLMTFVMYLARCSVMVRTLPWPIGALGPRNAVVY